MGQMASEMLISLYHAALSRSGGDPGSTRLGTEGCALEYVVDDD